MARTAATLLMIVLAIGVGAFLRRAPLTPPVRSFPPRPIAVEPRPGNIYPSRNSVSLTRDLPSSTSPRKPTQDPTVDLGSYQDAPLAFLSRAPADSLQLLPGIGPVLANRIIDARSGKRLFTSWSDVREVRGIGTKTIARLQALASSESEG